MKKVLSFLLFLTFLLLSFTSCSEPEVKEDELFPVVETLVEESKILNVIIFGEGIPTLASGKTVTASGTVKVKVSKSEDMKYPTMASGLIRRQLTSGFGLAANTPLQLVDKPEWVQGVAIVDGNIVLTLKKRGFVVIVK